MNKLGLKKEITATNAEAVQKITDSLKTVGFGILTRIDFHEKMKEKLGKEMKPVVVLGACKPSLAYEVFNRNTDFALLLPCNVVVREIGLNRQSVEIANPIEILQPLHDKSIAEVGNQVVKDLEKALEMI